MTVTKFTAEWCGQCKSVNPILKSAIEGLEVNFKEVDIDSNPDLASQYFITKLPTIVVEEEGQELKRFLGLGNIGGLRNFLTQH